MDSETIVNNPFIPAYDGIILANKKDTPEDAFHAKFTI
jgi:hypothetical protein